MSGIHIDGQIIEDPEKVGFNRSGLEQVLHILQQQISKGLHSGVQLHVARMGETVMNVALGEARPDIPMKRDSILNNFSSGKPWTTIAIAQLIEQNKLELYQTIQSIIPEFTNGKETCTIEHILLHEAGFPMFQYERDNTETVDEFLKDIYNEQAVYVPGTQCGYHGTSSWLILGELIRLIDGRRIEKYLEDEIFKPLNMNDTSLGMPNKRSNILGNRLAIKDTEPDYVHWGRGDNLFGNYPDPITLPGSSGFSSAYDMGKFYYTLWNGGQSLDGVRIIKKKTLDFFTETHRKGITDHILSLPTLGDQDFRPDFGYGFFKGKSLGMSCSPDTFGHGGLRCAKNHCDPRLDLVVNFISNTLVNPLSHTNRWEEINTAIYDACRYKL